MTVCTCGAPTLILLGLLVRVHEAACDIARRAYRRFPDHSRQYVLRAMS